MVFQLCSPSLTGGDGHGWRRVIVQGAFDCNTNRNSYVSGRLSLVAKCQKCFFESFVVRMDKFGVSFLFIGVHSILFRRLLL